MHKQVEVCKVCGCPRSMHEKWGCTCGGCDVIEDNSNAFELKVEKEYAHLRK